MNELNIVPNTGTFGEIAERINANFGLLETAVREVEGNTSKDCGLFSTLEALQKAHPHPTVGAQAKIGAEPPYAIYVCETDGVWKNTGKTVSPAVSVQVPKVMQTSGGSEDSVMSQKAVTALLTEYDVSAANGGRAYTLADAIAAVPAEFQKPGLKLSFVDSASGMQTTYRCISKGWSAAITDWICVESAEDADEYLYTVVDSDGRIVFGIREDGSVDWSKGIPDHIKAKLNEMMSGLSGKQDAVAGKSLVLSEVADAQDAVSDEEYTWALTDSEGRIVFGIREDGSMVYAKSDMLPSACMSDEDYLEVRTDATGKVLSTIDHAGREVHYNPVCFHNVRMPSGAVRDAVAPPR